MGWSETLFLRKYIEGKRIFVGSIGTVLKNGDTITTNLDGSLCFVASISSTVAYTGAYNVSEDGVNIVDSRFNISQGETIDLNIPFNVKKGKTYQFKLNVSDSRITLKSIYVGGQITDYNYFE